MKYKFLEHTADVMFEAYGDSLDELFINSALATFEVMVDLNKIQPKIKQGITLVNKKPDNLLFDWIAELIYLKDSKYLVFNEFKVKIKKEKELYKLSAIVSGDKIQPENQKVDVKAITFHKFKLEESNEKWKAKIVLDI